MATNFVFPEELTYFIESIRPYQIVDVGSPKWLDMHEMIIKLSQQALLEAAEHREEAVREFLIARDKLKVLIHEAFCVFLWKTRVLPHLLDMNPNPSATFFIYTVFFHEASVISLLDTALFHVSGCEALNDAAIDLVDYCAQGVAQVIGLVSTGYLSDEAKLYVDESVLSELERSKRDYIYKIGLRCISILNYLADNASALPLSATRRMVITHDIPWLMADLLSFRPWQRHTKKGMEKFIDDKWTLLQGEDVVKVNKHEAQSWFCLRQLLFNSALMASYEITEDRRNHLTKCQGLLHDTLLDQLPPLIELKQHLCHLGLSGGGATKSNFNRANLVLEELPEISENLLKQVERDGGFLEIAQRQRSVFLINNTDKICELAQRLNSAYNTDLLAELEQRAENDKAEEGACSSVNPTEKKCNKCLGSAEKKCGNCKTVYYCSRQCQMEDWPKHKSLCINV